MEIDTTTCWYIPKVYDEMINSIKKHLPLNEVQHGKVLINLLDIRFRVWRSINKYHN